MKKKENNSRENDRNFFLIIILTICFHLMFSGMIFSQTLMMSRDYMDPQLNVDEKKEIIDSITSVLNDKYVFPSKAVEMENHIRQNYLNGDYSEIDHLSAFIQVLTEDLYSICNDRHLRIIPSILIPPEFESDKTDEEIQNSFLERIKYENYGFEKVERLAGNIGYLKFNNFVNAIYAGPTAIAAMNFLANSDALIIDLRDNGGGNASMIRLISSYFFSESVHLNTFYYRITDEYDESWTYDFVPGKMMIDIPIYIITSSYTFSAAEEFTYNLQNLERAIIIGDTTGGGAHPITRHDFENIGITVVIPHARAINPISETNWEGVGIIPDIAVNSDRALESAHMEALKKILEGTENENKKFQILWILQILENDLNPISISEDEILKYTGKYGPRIITFEDNSLYYQRENRPKYRLIPMGNGTFMLDGQSNFRIKFEENERGIIDKLIGLYLNGHSDINYRDNE